MIWVGIGGMFGAITRFLLGKWISGHTSSSFPLGTWVINVTGSFLLGLLAVFHMDGELPHWLWLLLGTGFMGAYTTFSTFGYETIQLLERKEIRQAGMYIGLSAGLGISAAWVGGLLARTIL